MSSSCAKKRSLPKLPVKVATAIPGLAYAQVRKHLEDRCFGSALRNAREKKERIGRAVPTRRSIEAQRVIGFLRGDFSCEEPLEEKPDLSGELGAELGMEPQVLREAFDFYEALALKAFQDIFIDLRTELFE